MYLICHFLKGIVIFGGIYFVGYHHRPKLSNQHDPPNVNLFLVCMLLFIGQIIILFRINNYLLGLLTQWEMITSLSCEIFDFAEFKEIINNYLDLEENTMSIHCVRN